MTSSFSDFRGKVKDFINWNNPLLTGKEANYAGGMGSGQNSNYWVDALTGSDPAQNQIRTDANAHARGWQGYLADQLKAEGATSGWESRGYRDTQTLQRHQFDSDKAFLKLSDLRGTTDFTDPEGTNYTAAGDFQGRSYDSGTAFGLADTNNFNYGSNQTAYDNYGDLNLDSLSLPNYSAASSNNASTANTSTANTTSGGTNFLSSYNSLDELKSALTSGSTANTTTTDNSFDQFTKFLTAMSGMGLFGGGGNSGQGYGVGGVASAGSNNYFSNMANSSNAFRYNQNKLSSTGSINV